MNNIISIKDRGVGSGSRVTLTLFGEENVMIGFRTKARASVWVAANAADAFMVSPEAMDEALNHYYTRR